MNPVGLARPEIRALEPYASARTVAAAAGVLLNANENPFPPEGDGGLGLNRYPDPQPPALRKRLSEYYGVREDHLLITRGSDEGIDLVTRAFCRPGMDRVLVCPPCFGMYALSARIQGCEVVEIPLLDRGDAFEADGAGLTAAPECRLYFLCSPNNPTGNRIPAPVALALAERVAGHGLVVVDEAYLEFSGDDSLAGRIGHRPNLVVLRTLSKAFALAGCRIGAVVADPSVIGVLRRILPPYPLPTPAVAAAMGALTPAALARQAGQIKRLAEGKDRLIKALSVHPAIERVWPGEANFVLVRAADGPALVAAAGDVGIRLRDQSAQPGLANSVRISVGAPDEMDILLDFLEDWSP